MNWTGGTLQRTKHANKGVVQKQRAYFARARTKLQQSPNSPTAPFCPDFLRECDSNSFGRRIASSSSGSVHRAGHLAGKRARKEERHLPSTVRERQCEDDRRETISHSAQDRYRVEAENEKQRDKGTKEVTDSETQLLEANKKRLLRQQDWVGIVPSKPVELQYFPSKERAPTGKRRKLNATSRAVTRRLKPVTFPHGIVQEELDEDDTFISGALPVRATTNDIRVRIGSDALTTAASTQPINYASSQANSDSMLFDEEVNSSAYRKELETPQATSSSGHRLAIISQLTVDRSAGSERGGLPQHVPSAYHDLSGRADVHAGKRMRHAAADFDAVEPFTQYSEATHPSYELTHQVGGNERPLRLVFSPKPFPKVNRIALQANGSGEAQHAHADLNAGEIRTGRKSRNVGEAHQTDVRRRPNAPTIDDDEPWRPYLATDRSSPDHCSGTGALKPHTPARHARAESPSWPQHTARGNLTHDNLLTVSAPLPARNRPSARRLDARPLPRADAVKGFGKDEAFWKSCALGSDAQSVIETIHTHDETSEDSMSRATKGYASTRRPLSTAAAPVSSIPFPSTPFRPLSGQASRISDDVQCAPHSGSRSISSAAPSCAMWGGAELPHGEDVPGEKQGEEASAGSLFGEQPTYASLQTYASPVDEVFGDTGTSPNDLAWCGLRQDDVSRLAQASGSTIWHRDQGSSTWNNVDSDATGIDLVDADRLA
ncbi:hypothetical protein OPT61_g7041 [Boeremia exigua]|uniref:Uncharacterized protein n=1 Tax=Boeremia exigua TaxID=749465 RepID=A0ACC2I3Q7_9PLEO|nr:hypothetical protein OPT61_g7041 [Boeremia exigua]